MNKCILIKVFCKYNLFEFISEIANMHKRVFALRSPPYPFDAQDLNLTKKKWDEKYASETLWKKWKIREKIYIFAQEKIKEYEKEEDSTCLYINFVIINN